MGFPSMVSWISFVIWRMVAPLCYILQGLTLNFPVQDWLSRNLTISEHLTCQKCISPADLLCSVAPQDYPLPDQTDGGLFDEETV